MIKHSNTQLITINSKASLIDYCLMLIDRVSSSLSHIW